MAPPRQARGLAGASEVQASGAGLVVDSEDKLADALRTFCADADARNLAATRARDLVVAKYTWPVVARQMLARYEARASLLNH